MNIVTGTSEFGASNYRIIKLIMELRARGISSTSVLSALEKVPRELFVPEMFGLEAYNNSTLPIECGQTISQPYVVALMTEKLDLNDRCKILEVGTGTGFQTAILAQLCRRVYTIERYRRLLEDAEYRFRKLRLTNITSMTGDGTKGWPAQAPFDRIMVTAAAPRVPDQLLAQLKAGGKMIVPVDNSQGEQDLILFHKDEDEAVSAEVLCVVRFVPLVSGAIKNG